MKSLENPSTNGAFQHDVLSPEFRSYTPFSIDDILGLNKGQSTPSSSPETPLNYTVINHHPPYIWLEQPDFDLYHRKAEPTSPVLDSNSDGSSTAKARRQRTSFTNYQIEQMEEAFKLSKFIDSVAREELGTRIGLCESRINVWFQNRRAKLRKIEKHCQSPNCDPFY